MVIVLESWSVLVKLNWLEGRIIYAYFQVTQSAKRLTTKVTQVDVILANHLEKSHKWNGERINLPRLGQKYST